MKYSEQMRIVRDPKNLENVQVPKMPLLVILSDGTIGEACTLRAAVAIVVGSTYLDCESSQTEWHMRVEAARRECMKALSTNINAVVFDTRVGIIENNYAADLNDSDYILEPEDDSEEKRVYVDTERSFLLSLVKLGAITVLERSDSFMLRDHEQWKLIKDSSGVLKCCVRCIFLEEEKNYCPVYNRNVIHTDGTDCTSYSVMLPGFVMEYNGGEYINLTENDIDKLTRI